MVTITCSICFLYALLCYLYFQIFGNGPDYNYKIDADCLVMTRRRQTAQRGGVPLPHSISVILRFSARQHISTPNQHLINSIEGKHQSLPDISEYVKLPFVLFVKYTTK